MRKTARDPQSTNLSFLFFRQHFHGHPCGSSDRLTVFGRVDGRACGFSSEDADAVPGDAKVGADDLEVEEESDDGAGYGGRNWDTGAGYGIKLRVIEGDADTVHMNSGEDAGPWGGEVGDGEADGVAGGELDRE